jgi:hypothetical protein
MEAAIIFLLKAAASGTAGHYIKKALEKIDSDVGALFVKDASEGAIPATVVDEIKQVIERKDVAKQVNEVFEKSVEKSLVIPTDLSLAATPDDVVQVIQTIVSLGFSIAHRERFDLVLPGSPLGPESLSIFECSTDSEQSVKVLDRTISWESLRANLYIFPMPKGPDEYWQQYLQTIRDLREESSRRLLRLGQSIPKPEGLDGSFKVTYLTAGSVHYMNDLDRLVEGGSNKKEIVRYLNWQQGFDAMISGIKPIQDLRYLAIGDWEKLKQLVTKLSEVLSQAEQV